MEYVTAEGLLRSVVEAPGDLQREPAVLPIGNGVVRGPDEFAFAEFDLGVGRAAAVVGDADEREGVAAEDERGAGNQDAFVARHGESPPSAFHSVSDTPSAW